MKYAPWRDKCAWERLRRGCKRPRGVRGRGPLVLFATALATVGIWGQTALIFFDTCHEISGERFKKRNRYLFTKGMVRFGA